MDYIDYGKQSYREAKVESIERELKSEMHKYARLSRIYKRVDKAMSFALGTCGVFNVICTTGTLSTAATGIGAVVCIPLSSLAIINSIGQLVLTVLSKRTRNKHKKHEDTVRIIRNYQSKVKSLMSKALEDDEIDEVEFEGVVKCLGFYYEEKDLLRQPSSSPSSVESPP